MLLSKPLYLPEGLPRREQADVVGISQRIVGNAGLELSYHDHEEAVSFLIEEAWQLSLVYKPGILSGSGDKRNNGFGAFATTTLRRRLVDWQRQRSGRTRWSFGDGRVYERTLPSLVPLDDRPDHADPSQSVDAGSDRVSSLAGILGTGSSRSDRRDSELREDPARLAA